MNNSFDNVYAIKIILEEVSFMNSIVIHKMFSENVNFFNKRPTSITAVHTKQVIGVLRQ